MDITYIIIYHRLQLSSYTMATKWGIISASKISHDFVLALEKLSTEDHKVVAVAAKDISRAKHFADDFGIPAYYGSYEELGNDSNVGMLYILYVIYHLYIYIY